MPYLLLEYMISHWCRSSIYYPIQSRCIWFIWWPLLYYVLYLAFKSVCTIMIKLIAQGPKTTRRMFYRKSWNSNSQILHQAKKMEFFRVEELLPKFSKRPRWNYCCILTHCSYVDSFLPFGFIPIENDDWYSSVNCAPKLSLIALKSLLISEGVWKQSQLGYVAVYSGWMKLPS